MVHWAGAREAAQLTPSVQLAVVLLLAGLFALSLELFVPSAGILFFVAGSCIVGSVIIAFQVHWAIGLIFLGIVMLMIFLVPGMGLRIWRHSPVGRQMFLEPGEDSAEEAKPASQYDGLVGEIGKTLTPLRPAGSTEILGRRVDTITQGIPVGKGELVKVVEVTGNRVVVRPLTEKEQGAFAGTGDLPDFDFTQ